jgi:anaerobic selenocysteine-containing dehydrogenase
MQAPVKKTPVERKLVRAACPHDCPDTCAMQVTVENGVAVKVEGAKDHPFTAGTLCTKVAKYLERTYSKDRLLYPLKRVGPKGKGGFKRISWDEALDTIAAKFSAIADDDPQGILPYDYAGTMGCVQSHSMGRRFFNRLGASRLDRTICSSAGKAGMKITLGGSFGMDPERFDEAKLILVWGSNPVVSNLHLWSRAQEAKRRGAKLIAIDPYRSLTAEKCHEHLAPLPGTDAALALALMHVIIGENLYDRDYVAKYTLGFEQLRESASRTIRRRRSRRSPGSRPGESSRSRASTPGRGPRRSASTTACSGTRAAAWRCGTSSVSQRSPETGAIRRAERY